MPTDLKAFVRDLRPEVTVLFLGSGSSIPSHAPSSKEIINKLASTYSQISDGFDLAELAEIIEQKTTDRRRMIETIQAMFSGLRPVGGMSSLPLYEWKSIYTTNYDELIEDAYKIRKVDLITYSSDFDFTLRGRSNAVRLYKIHGTISKDISIGHKARMILTESDYLHTKEFRSKMYDALRSDLAESHLVIIGHSLADQNVKEEINRALNINSESLSGGRISLLLYTKDENRAILYENKGIRVIFSGIDEFLLELAKSSPSHNLLASSTGNPIADNQILIASIIDIENEITHASPDVVRMFNGSPANYADIYGKLTFERKVTSHVCSALLDDNQTVSVILGAIGVGKTTAARQILLKMRERGNTCWEHKTEETLEVVSWIAAAKELSLTGRTSVLLIDDAHEHLHEINELIDNLVDSKISNLKIVLVASRNNWLPRWKTANLYKNGREFIISQLDLDEINSLITLVDTSTKIRAVIDDKFSGFSREAKVRRLSEICEADMFVCLKNIFASERYDDIILREYAELPEINREIYKVVAALETSGVRVHRQLLIRMLSIPAKRIKTILDGLTDIITEISTNPRQHIYILRGRHAVINNIITKFCYPNIEDLIELFDDVIDNIVPAYDIEIRSIRELCNIGSGIPKIPSKKEQNRLLRKMISVAPGERVPRHRLIHNLIDLNELDSAQTEMRVFENDFGLDGPVARYQIDLNVARAIKTPGLLIEHRLVILEKARQGALQTLQRYNYSPQVFKAYCELGVAIYKLSGDVGVYEDAISEIKKAEERIGDPNLTVWIRRLEMRVLSAQTPNYADPD